jgi:hypothetical protein
MFILAETGINNMLYILFSYEIRQERAIVYALR